MRNAWQSASIGADPFLVADEVSPHHAEDPEACGLIDGLAAENADSERVTAQVPHSNQASDQPEAEEIESADFPPE